MTTSQLNTHDHDHHDHDINLRIADIGNAATKLQSLAADPTQNIWVNASAGTGKTKVLTERVLRLLLPRDGLAGGTPPENILCITFTKAGANEMITRVMSVLSHWAVCSESALKNHLFNLLGQDATLDQFDRARRLFASIIDLPDGLKVTTIHAFCQSILGRFVVEANLPPNFSVMEDRESQRLIRNVRDQLVHDILNDKTEDDLKQAFSWLSVAKASGDIQTILQSLLKQRKKLNAFFMAHPDYQSYLKQILEIPKNHNHGDDLFEIYFCEENFRPDAIKRLAKAMEHGTATEIKKSQDLYDFCAADLDEKRKKLHAYQSVFLTQKQQLPKNILGKPTQKYDPQAANIAMDEALRILKFIDAQNSLKLYQSTCSLLCIAREITHRYTQAKINHQVIDYDDLIHKTLDLFNGPMRDWVLYKLDYKIDHVLLDEAQDTSPDQWEILKSVLGDFTSGQSVREDEITRTVFVVGDNKQSIFGFQGADPVRFNETHDLIKNKFMAADLPWHDVPMNTSFRSTDAVLSFVDQVFATDAARASLTQNPSHYKSHGAYRTGHAGRVDVWPLFKAPKSDRKPWVLPTQITDSHNAMAYLAQQMANQIDRWIQNKEILKSKNRPIKPGDIMILVRRRNQMVDHLVRALNTRNIPVSGVDRLKVASHIAVKDIIAVLQFALMPDDDLTLATLLKSPLIGWNDDVLEEYAYMRDGTLWHQIRNNAPDDVVIYLQQLIENISGRNSFHAISDILNKPCVNYGMTGWQVFLGRLGEDCRDALEELLSMAQQFDANNAGDGIQGFINQISKNTSDIKREMDGGMDKVRIMTVHASKGLQAPIVFMPDTTSVPKKPGQSKDGFLWVDDDAPLWSPSSKIENDLFKSHKEKLHDDQIDEYYRLLYVAMTRAEDRLIICGTLGGNTKKLSDESWYGLMETACRNIGHHNDDSALNVSDDYFQHDSNCDYLLYETDQLVDPKIDKLETTNRNKSALPPWAKKIPAVEQHPPRVLKPSQDQDNDMAVPVRSPLSSIDDQYRFRRGNLTHALLQYLPDIPMDKRESSARNYLNTQAPDVSEAIRDSILTETLAVLNAPEFNLFFANGSMAEVPITGMVTRDNGKIDIINGQIDRMVVSENEIWIVDFKSNRPPPKDPNKIPTQYRNQLQAYKILIQDIYPNHQIHCALLWTDGPFMNLLNNV